MSRSWKDGRKGGSHRNTQNREVWSKRCPLVSCTPIDDRDYKRTTHRYERRQARRLIHDEVADVERVGR